MATSEDFLPCADRILGHLRHVCASFDDLEKEHWVTKFGGEAAMDIVRTHPLVIIGGLSRKPLFSVPPEQFLLEMRVPRVGDGAGTAS